MKRYLKPPEVGDYELKGFLGWVWSSLIGPLILKTATKAADYEALRSDGYIGVTSTAAPRTITLPALNSMEDGACMTIKDQSGGAGTNSITIEGYLSETIDGAANKVINTNYGSETLIKMSTGWFSI